MSSKKTAIAKVSDNAALQQSLGDRLAFLGFSTGMLFLACLFGIVLSISNAAPYRWTSDALHAFNALRTQQKMIGEEFPRFLWKPVRSNDSGVTDYDASKSQPGLTLYSSADRSGVTLIDADGNKIHSWSAPFGEVFSDVTWRKAMIPQDKIYIRSAQIQPNGDLLAVFETTQATPNGMGFAKLDKDSNVIWAYNENCHHDFDVDQAGNIYVLTHEVQKTDFPGKALHGHMNIEDYLTVLSPEGEEIKKINLVNAVLESPFYRISLLRRDTSGDVLHANTVNTVTEEFAAHHEGVEAGQMMVCFRNYNLVSVVDPQSGKIVWATNGPWFNPHDPDPLANGNIRIFDNCSIRGTKSVSRVIEFNPTTQEILWEYDGNADSPLSSEIRSTSQLLPNGNTLICESNGGRIVEVTSEGEKVWQFVSPVRGGENQNLLPIMAAAQRYEMKDLPFLNLDAKQTKMTATPVGYQTTRGAE